MKELYVSRICEGGEREIERERRKWGTDREIEKKSLDLGNEWIKGKGALGLSLFEFTWAH